VQGVHTVHKECVDIGLTSRESSGGISLDLHQQKFKECTGRTLYKVQIEPELLRTL
jgi:hypothetical protein